MSKLQQEIQQLKLKLFPFTFTGAGLSGETWSEKEKVQSCKNLVRLIDKMILILLYW